MTLIEEKTLADHDINVRSIRQELQLLEEQLKKHGRNESSTVTTDTDTISRQAVLDALNALQTYKMHEGSDEFLIDRADIRKALEKLPPSPSRPQGRWIPCTKNGLPLSELACREGQKWYGYKCSKCNSIYKGNALTESPYCQFCGADMRMNQQAEVTDTDTISRPQWIPCSERLPELDVFVIATTQWHDITMACRIGDGQWFIHEGDSNAYDDDVLAWMPLPEPYHRP